MKKMKTSMTRDENAVLTVPPCPPMLAPVKEKMMVSLNGLEIMVIPTPAPLML